MNGPAVAPSPGVTVCNVARSVTWCSSSLPSSSAKRERRAVHVQMIELSEQIGQRADVILMPVRQHHGFDAGGVGAYVVEIGQHQIDARHVAAGEGQPHVDDEDAPIELDACHVATDLPDSPEEDDATVTGARGDRLPPVPCEPARVSSAVAGTSGSRGRPGGAAEHLERGLHRDRVGGDEQRVVQRREGLVDLPRRRHVAGVDQVHHLTDLGAHQVARHADDAHRSQAHVSERGPVVAGVDLEPVGRLGDHARDGLEVARGILDRHDVGALREPEQGVVFDADRGTAGDVVQDHRQVGCVCDVLEVGHQAPAAAACCSTGSRPAGRRRRHPRRPASAPASRPSSTCRCRRSTWRDHGSRHPLPRTAATSPCG